MCIILYISINLSRTTFMVFYGDVCPFELLNSDICMCKHYLHFQISKVQILSFKFKF